RSKGSSRRAIIFPDKFNFSPMDIEEKRIEVTFGLPKGSYGTVVVREIIKNKF
ncbi:MAG: tRNA pseudouridine(13) synthase TruD, partial [Candidatus Heimdallarchaeota archaeon]